MQTIHQETTLSFADLLNPLLHTRDDLDGAAFILDPIEEAALDLALDVEARGLTAREWDALAATALDPRFAAAFSALCTARAVEARRINGGRHVR